MIIIYYVMDSLRSDVLSCYGHEKRTSPHMDALAEKGVLFENAFSQATWTRPSGASMLSCTYPSVHGVHAVYDRLPDGIPLVPEVLKEAGFSTVAITSMGNISPSFGFGRGFDRFLELYKLGTLREKREIFKVDKARIRSDLDLKTNEYPLATSEDINEFLIPVIKEHKGTDLFVFVWSIDTHDPYFHRNKDLATFCKPLDHTMWVSETMGMHGPKEIGLLKDMYRDMVYFNDYHLGVLFRELETMGVLDETLLVLTGDHGEAFNEHRLNSHGGMPYDEQIKIPLIMKFPGSEYGGRRVEGLVQHIDIGRTVIDYALGREDKTLLQGKSLLPLLNGEAGVNDFVFAEARRAINAFHKYVAIRSADYKFMDYFAVKPRPAISMKAIKGFIGEITFEGRTGRKLFSLKNDPRERENIFRRERGVAEALGARMKEVMRENETAGVSFTRRKREKAELDDETAKQLKALGYFD